MDSEDSASALDVAEEESESESEVVVAGASQCQWSPWGSQPIDSVGLGARLSEVDSLSAVEVAGASQCLGLLVRAL
jgi:hypothetical protein